MAGYIGTKAVNLSTTAATVGGDADIGGDLTVDTSTLHVDSANNRVGIGTDSPDTVLNVVSSITQAKFEGSVQGNIIIEKSGAEGFSIYSSAAGTLGFYDNNSSAERMRIDSAGRVTKPYQPAFLVGYNGSTFSTGSGSQQIIYNYKMFDIGNNYNTSTGRFTAPVSGTYIFDHTISARTAFSGVFEVKIFQNGTERKRMFAFGPNNGHGASATVIIYCNAGDYVDSRGYWGGGGLTLSGNQDMGPVSQGTASSFSGYLIG